MTEDRPDGVEGIVTWFWISILFQISMQTLHGYNAIELRFDINTKEKGQYTTFTRF
jgi:hypothetical protein